VPPIEAKLGIELINTNAPNGFSEGSAGAVQGCLDAAEMGSTGTMGLSVAATVGDLPEELQRQSVAHIAPGLAEEP
jgi:hypothetical protein